MIECKYGFLCALGVDKEKMFVGLMSLSIIWFFFRKISYENYVQKNYPALSGKETRFDPRNIDNFLAIKTPELRRRYIRYIIELLLIFALALVVMFT
jgi:hypothetical protein